MDDFVWHFYRSETENRLFQYGSAFFVGLCSVLAGSFGSTYMHFGRNIVII